MKITYEMERFIYIAMDERIKKAYPKTGGNLALRNRIMTATIEGLKKQKESVLSLALFYAAEEANKDKVAE